MEDRRDAIWKDTRLHPWRALRCLAAVARDPERTDVGAVMVRALEGRSGLRLRQRIASHPTGARILAERRRLDRALCDRAALAALPPGSLGRSYAAWCRAEGISAEGLIRASDELDATRLDAEPVDDWELLELRSAVSHDLWHVVTGYGRDLLGELALLYFMWIQTRNTGLLLPCALGLLSQDRGGRRLVFEARRRARRAAWLPAADWEALLPERLPAVRERLRLGAPPRYTPVWREGSAELATSA